MNVAAPSLTIAFAAGLLSFVSPCCLPLYPSYISYITGVSFDQIKSAEHRGVRSRAVIHSLFFIIGFSIIFVALGLSASLIGQFFITYKTIVRVLGGALIIVMGLFLLELIQWDFLFREKKWHLASKPTGYLGSILVGISFAAGWTPCIGPILSGVLLYAASNPGSGLLLMTSYTLGFAIPFLILAVTLGSIRWLQRYSMIVSKIGGAIMVVMGVLLMTDQMTRITAWLIHLTGGFTGY
ncbi:MAG: cytochrome biosis protein [Bacilli bacterium]|nr:cytochrome biosis protein [Bacilli bacterium]